SDCDRGRRGQGGERKEGRYYLCDRRGVVICQDPSRLANFSDGPRETVAGKPATVQAGDPERAPGVDGVAEETGQSDPDDSDQGGGRAVPVGGGGQPGSRGVFAEPERFEQGVL